MLKFARLLAVVVLPAFALPAHAASWSRHASPTAGPAQVYGGYAAGCVAGAQQLELLGQHFQVMRPSRNRYYGHPDLLPLVDALAATAARHDARLLVGDIAQPRGGPMPSGHRSHQVGLDGDIWLLKGPVQAFSGAQTESVSARSVVDPIAGAVIAAEWGPYQRDVLWTAANWSQTARIFVNPVIKKHLCLTETDTGWLHKLRPWWGHDAHFHVRLECPPDSPLCESQGPIPAGDGCIPDLDNWIADQRAAALNPQERPTTPPPKPVILPAACDTVLRAPSP